MLGDALLSVLDGGDATALIDQIEQALGTAPPRALERATALYVWKRTWEAAQPDARHGGDRRSDRWRRKDQAEKISFWSVASAATGVGERQIQLDIALCDALGPADIKRLWHSLIADNAAALKTVAGLEGPARAGLFAVWADNPKLNFGAAMTAARLRAENDSDEARFRTLLSGWSRAGSKARRRFLEEIGVNRAVGAEVVASWRKRGGA